MSRTRGGGWSQMRYQRHADNFHLLHAKEVVDVLGRVVRDEEADHVILAGDDVIVPLLREQMPPRLREKVIDILRLDIRTPEHVVLKATMESLREHNTQTDAERVRHLLDEYRAGGLAVVGTRDTLSAVYQGQADELLLSASARAAEGPDGQATDGEADDGATHPGGAREGLKGVVEVYRRFCQMLAARRRRRAFVKIRGEFARCGYPLHGLSDAEIEASLPPGTCDAPPDYLGAKTVSHAVGRLRVSGGPRPAEFINRR